MRFSIRKRKLEAAEYLREWIEHGMPLRADGSLPTDVLTALEWLEVPMRDGTEFNHRGSRVWHPPTESNE